MNLLTRILITSIVAFALAYILSGVAIDSFWTAILLAIVLALLNAVVKPIMVLLTLPATILTLGLFLFVLDALVILLADKLLNGFQVRSFWWALLFSLLLSLVNSFLPGTKKDK